MRIVLLPLVLLSSLAAAGDLPAGAGCDNSNSCRSKQCFEHRCQPNSNAPSGLGGLCQTNPQCLSKNCVNRSCAPPKAKAPSGSGTSQRTSPRQQPVAEPLPDEPDAPPAEAPLPAPTPCSEDLMATVYKDKAGVPAYLRYAAADCSVASPEMIEQAKQLFSEGYGKNFGVTLRTVKEATPEQLECAKKRHDKKTSHFEVPSLCLQSQDVIACTDDLAVVVFKDLKPDSAKSQAKMECARRSPSIIAGAKKMFLEGYGTSFSALCDILEKASPEEVECSKKEYAFMSEGFTKYSGFSIRDVCKQPAEIVACYFDLLATEMKQYEYDDRNRPRAMSLCRGHTSEEITLAKALTAAGYLQEFSSLAGFMKKATPEQRACLKKQKLAKLQSDKRRFEMPKVCLK